MDEIEEIKRRIDIVDFIGQYLTLKKAGRNFKAVCPFHAEKTPSFIVSPEKQIWHCFGCQKGGDIFGFLMEYESIEFADALKILAEKAGVKLTPKNPQLKKTKDELYQMNLTAAKFYHYLLTTKEIGQKPLEYLEKARGLTRATIDKFLIGFAPDSWDLVSRLLVKRNFAKDHILQSGLVIIKPDGGFYDRFRSRLTFPISDIAKNVLGFSGRIFSTGQIKTAGRDFEPAKYINSPDTPIYNKSRILYGLDKAKKEILAQKFVIIVEGQMDVVACHQAGIENVVASSGTAITADQLQILKKFTTDFAYCFDADAAGEEATKRAIATAHQIGIMPKIIVTPEAKDPAEILQKEPELFKKAITQAKDAVDFYLDLAKQKYQSKNMTSQEKQVVATELLGIIKKISEPVLVGDYLKKLSRFLDTDEKFLYEAYQKMPRNFSPSPNPRAQNQNQAISTPQAIHEPIEEIVIGAALKFPEIAKPILSKLNLANFSSPENQKIAKAIIKSYTENNKVDEKLLKKELTEAELKTANSYFLEAENEFGQLSEKGLKDEIVIACQRLKAKRLDKIKNDFQKKIAEAEKTGNRSQIKELILQLQKQIGGNHDQAK
ncbi:MAG TPA: DNA primase [Patescibacteria group bacterium]|nr:DNA primase [Patescibacteria group bacterium]